MESRHRDDGISQASKAVNQHSFDFFEIHRKQLAYWPVKRAGSYIKCASL
jgi:hypothetical protein